MTEIIMTDIAGNLQQVRTHIAQACERVDRDPAEVTLVAVSKTKSEAAILEATNAGQWHFGENRIEEAQGKIPNVRQQTTDVTWHMIGHVQSRKAKLVPSLFDVVHSVDSLKLARKLSTQVVKQGTGTTLDILLEINLSGEEAKYGFPARHWQHDKIMRDHLWENIRQILLLPGLNLRGLMTMAPFVRNTEETRPLFRGMRELCNELEHFYDIELPDLSMGMTNDYPIAIEEGATIIRIGRAIFGERS